MNPVTGLSLGRILVGLLTFFRPQLAGRLFGFDPVANPQLPTMARLFAAREVALGTATLLATGPTRRTLVTAGALVDASDAVTGVVGIREGSSSRLTGVLFAVVGLAAAGSVVREIAG